MHNQPRPNAVSPVAVPDLACRLQTGFSISEICVLFKSGGQVNGKGGAQDSSNGLYLQVTG
jgi:hypothetical protein